MIADRTDGTGGEGMPVAPTWSSRLKYVTASMSVGPGGGVGDVAPPDDRQRARLGVDERHVGASGYA